MKKHLLKNKFLFFLTIIITIVYSVFSVLLAFVLMNIVNLIYLKDDFHKFYKTILISAIFVIAVSLISFLKNYIKSVFMKKTTISYNNYIFNNIIDFNITKINLQNSGEYISILTNDVKLIENQYLNNIIEIFGDVFIFTIAVISLIKINVILGLFTIASSILLLIIPKITNKNLSLLRKEYSNKLQKFTSKVNDILSGFEIMKNFNAFDKGIVEFNKESETVEQVKYSNFIYEGAVDSVSTFCAYGIQFSVILLGVYLALNNYITVGAIIAVGQLMDYIISPIPQIIARINTIKSTKPIIEKIDNISTGEVEDKGKISKEYFEDKITFSELSFSYDGKKNAIEDMNLEIQKGKKYAIVGQTGSGKSTILKLLLNYFSEYSGEIKIDGINIKDIKLESLYKLISIIQQNVFLFEDTIKENITLYQPYKENEINKAIYLSGLEEMVNSLENNVNTYVGEAGNKLSGGEKQRISIARALIKKTPILLLDEATGSLDNKTAYNIESSLLELEDETLIVVTHRLNEDLLKRYDKIIVIEDGRVVEEGTFSELMDKNGFFFGLYNVENIA